MKRVLWISRHEMTMPQWEDLERVMDDAVQLTPWRETVHSMTELQPAIDQSDAVAAVLPPDLLADLLRAAKGKPVLRAISDRKPTGRIVTLPDGRNEPEFTFVHDCWEQILRIDVQTQRL